MRMDIFRHFFEMVETTQYLQSGIVINWVEYTDLSKELDALRAKVEQRARESKQEVAS